MCPLRQPALRTTPTNWPPLPSPPNPNPIPKCQQQHKQQHRNSPPLQLPPRRNPKPRTRGIPLRRRGNLAPPRHRRTCLILLHLPNINNHPPQTRNRRRRRASRALRRPETRPERQAVVRSAQPLPGKHRHPSLHHLRRDKGLLVPRA